VSIYNFNSNDAFAFASFIGMKTRQKGNQLEFTVCPYCKSVNDKYKFGISLSTGQFECKRASCGVKGNMITLSRDFNFSLGKDTDAYYMAVDYTSKQWKSFKDKFRDIEVRPKAIEYLMQRGIPESVIRDYEITTRADSDDIVVFPFKDTEGALTFVKYRNTAFIKGKTKGSKEWCESNCKPILFGMNKCNTEKGSRLVITEGQIDSLSVTSANIENAVSVPTGAKGFTWVPYCYDFVNQFNQIIVFGDCENGIITLADEIGKRWKEKVRVVQQCDYLGCKDANEILQKHGIQAIKNAVDNAEPINTACIKPLAKVEQVDIMSVEKFRTGMPSLDNILDGGFRIGQLAILTGKRGEGKSTLASLFGIQAIEQGFKSFFYSGELPDFMFRNWMDCQLCGKSEHTQSENDLIDAWYGDRAYIYDNSILDDSDEYITLIDAIKIAIIQRGCKFIMLDNLMTAMDDDLSLDIYREQSKFIGQLSSLAKQFNVFILLIAHPRKSNGSELTNDDISGSSHITDKADITIMFGKPKKDDIDEYERIIDIRKNRLTGKITKSPIRVTYDYTGSRRLAENADEFRNMRFSWKPDDNETFYNFEQLEVPF